MDHCKVIYQYFEAVSNLILMQRGTTWSIYVMVDYQSFTESLYMEAEMYDINAVVASVGGSLGLFLGFSCYEYGKKFIDQIPSS